MGHALHGLLSQVRFPFALSAPMWRAIFVELPSQLYEALAGEPRY